MLFTPYVLPLLACSLTATQRLEAEDAQLDRVQVSTERAGYSGQGYVTGFVPEGAKVTWRFRSKAGVYSARLGYSTPGGTKGYVVAVNGVRHAAMLADIGSKFGATELGKIVLREGENEISVERGWGYFDVDFVEFASVGRSVPALKTVPSRLSDPKASASARSLMAFLTRTYGKKTISGQVDQGEANYVRQSTGKLPAILGSDLMDFSPSRTAFGADPKNLVDSWIRAGKAGSILTLCWHWNAPTGLLNREFTKPNGDKVNALWYRGFYTEASTFDVAKAMADPNSGEYRLILRDIDAIAVPLKRLSDAGIPVLWRPLHEAEGGWFWWGAKGPQPCLQLWKLLYDRLTKHHQLHNLIWVWNSSKLDWYPGDDTVDIMAIDEYPGDHNDRLSSQWESLIRRFDGQKLLALAEFPGVPDVDGMRQLGVRWAYFVSWTGSVGPRSEPLDRLRRVYTSPHVANQVDVPSFLKQ